jgi:hypothetical protein
MSIHSAVEEKNLGKVKDLIAGGADVNAKNVGKSFIFPLC